MIKARLFRKLRQLWSLVGGRGFQQLSGASQILESLLEWDGSPASVPDDAAPLASVSFFFFFPFFFFVDLLGIERRVKNTY